MCWIELKGMKFHAFIGHYDEEKDIGNKFNVDLKVKTNCQKAGETDKLRYALDYQKLYAIVKNEMKKKCNLVENAAQRIIDGILEKFPDLEEIYVKVTKLSPKLGGIVDEVSIILEYKKQ